MLLAVDFHFQVDLAGAHIGRLYAEDEGIVVFLLFDDGFAQPGEGFAQMVYRFFYGFGVHLDQVDVFRIAGLRLKVELVQRRATTEGEVFLQEGVAVYRYQRPADNQILLHQTRRRPRYNRTPLGYECSLYHKSSISISWFTATFHFLSTSASSTDAPSLSGTAFIFIPPDFIRASRPSAMASSSSTQSSR